MRLGFSAFILAGLCASSAWAATPVPLGDSGAHYFPSANWNAAVLPGGGYAVIWTWAPAPIPPGGNVDVHMQWVRPDGSRVFPEEGLTVSASDDQELGEAVAADPAGGVFVAFARGPRNLLRTRILVQRFDAEGHRLWPGAGVLVAAESGNRYQLTPNLVPDGQGGVFVCLTSLFGDGIHPPQSRIVCQHLSAAGRRQWSNHGLDAGGIPGLKSGSVTLPDGEGGILAIWRNDRTADAGNRLRVVIEGQRLAPDGSRLWSPRGRVLQRTGLLGQQVVFIPQPLRAVPDGQGGAVLASQARSGEDFFDIVAQRVDRTGRPLWGDGVAVVSEEGFQHLDNLFAGPDGGAFVAAQHLRPHQDELVIHRVEGGGHVRWSVPVMAPEVNPSPNDLAAYGSFDGGLLRMVWQHLLPDFSGSEVRVLVLDLDGNRLNGPGGEALTGATVQNVPRGFVYDPELGQGLAVWNVNGIEGTAAGAIVDGH